MIDILGEEGVEWSRASTLGVDDYIKNWVDESNGLYPLPHSLTNVMVF